MAQNHRQAQAKQLLDEQPVIEISFQLAQLTPVAKHQQAQAVHFMHCKAWCIGVIKNVCAVLVVIIVRNLAANFMQLRRPAQVALGML